MQKVLPRLSNYLLHAVCKYLQVRLYSSKAILSLRVLFFYKKYFHGTEALTDCTLPANDS